MLQHWIDWRGRMYMLYFVEIKKKKDCIRNYYRNEVFSNPLLICFNRNET